MIESTNVTTLILLAAALTYGTRIGGHLILMQFSALNFRVEAALNAVPVAVLSALIAPAAISHGWAEAVALLVAGLVALRLPSLWVIVTGLAVLVALRGF